MVTFDNVLYTLGFRFNLISMARLSTKGAEVHFKDNKYYKRSLMSQLHYGLVVTYCIVYHYTKRAMLARLLANKGPAIYVVHLNRYFVIPP